LSYLKEGKHLTPAHWDTAAAKLIYQTLKDSSFTVNSKGGNAWQRTAIEVQFNVSEGQKVKSHRELE
jgi:hypothetical protein